MAEAAMAEAATESDRGLFLSRFLGFSGSRWRLSVLLVVYILFLLFALIYIIDIRTIFRPLSTVFQQLQSR